MITKNAVMPKKLNLTKWEPCGNSDWELPASGQARECNDLALELHGTGEQKS